MPKTKKYVLSQAVVSHTYTGRVRYATRRELTIMENALNRSAQRRKRAKD